MSTPGWRRPAWVTKDAEVIAIVELDLGLPGGSRDEASAESR